MTPRQGEFRERSDQLPPLAGGCTLYLSLGTTRTTSAGYIGNRDSSNREDPINTNKLTSAKLHLAQQSTKRPHPISLFRANLNPSFFTNEGNISKANPYPFFQTWVGQQRKAGHPSWTQVRFADHSVCMQLARRPPVFSRADVFPSDQPLFSFHSPVEWLVIQIK